jgi:hypothetical protein
MPYCHGAILFCHILAKFEKNAIKLQKKSTEKEPYLNSGDAFGKTFSMKGPFLCKKSSKIQI